VYLLKIGELSLKGGNKKVFENALKNNLREMLRGSGAMINTSDGRFYVHCSAEAEKPVEFALNSLSGITGWAKAQKTEKNINAVLDAVLIEAKKSYANGERSFKIDARRTDKSFPFNSYELCCAAGDAVIKEMPDFKVNLYKPDVKFSVEIREKAYIYGKEQRTLRGLPVGTASRGMLLLSGGIDSPVAGYAMALRGMRINAVYFHAYPYTSEEARLKVVRLAEIISRYALSINLTTINFTKVQMKIKDGAPEEWTTVLLRMAMMETASRLARSQKCKCLITGESLAQVASQTIENISCTESRAQYPVLRPLIGTDKEDITKTSIAIGAYETSILPYQDCCVLFSPPHPVLRGDPAVANELYDKLDLPPLLSEALAEKTTERCAYKFF
jgi:thiamine biosynthesis protein ThiI